MNSLLERPRSVITTPVAPGNAGHRCSSHDGRCGAAARTAPSERSAGASSAAPAPVRGDFLTPRLSRSQETGLSIALIVISACELMALFYAYQNRYVKWESLWVIFVEVAPPPPPRPAPTSLTPSLSAVLPLCCLATAHVLRRDGGGARQRVRDV